MVLTRVKVESRCNDENTFNRQKKELGESKRTAFGDLTNFEQQQQGKGKAGQEPPAKVRHNMMPPPDNKEWVKDLAACDQRDVEKPEMCAEYSEDIYAHLRSTEKNYMVPKDYMKDQRDINEKMRSILIDWLVEVHLKFKLRTETMFLTVSLIDRYLSKTNIDRTRLQLVGVTCMLIASKYEEVYAPEPGDFVYITDKAYTKAEILHTEVNILKTLNWQVTTPTTNAFLTRFKKVMKCEPSHAALVQYIIELALLDYGMLKHAPSHLASAALFLSNRVLKLQPAWPQTLVPHTTYNEGTIRACAKELCAILQNAEKSSLQAVRKKFSSNNYHKVAKMIASASS